MKAIALVVSARRRGNCYDFAEFMLHRLQISDVETELVNFHDYQITPCQRCSYECIQHLDPAKGVDAPCPIQDDVRPIWEKTWTAEILFLFIPNYGGLPPALWFAFSQRVQGFYRQAPVEKLKRSVVSAVILAAPHQSSGAPWLLSFIGDEVKGLERKVAGFEVINPTEFDLEYTFNRLLPHSPEIQRRLEFLADRTLQVANRL
jgi:multimeric flavodoxin WrbA